MLVLPLLESCLAIRSTESIEKHRAIIQSNAQIEPHISSLLSSSYFRHYKINLDKPCPFWQQSKMCTSRGCSVEIMEKGPESWNNQALGDVRFPFFQLDQQLFRQWDSNSNEFCQLDGDDSGVFVDLVENPERFTGYAGESSRKIWKSLYEENCFSGNGLQSGGSSLWAKCKERQLFYRLISGLHASISIHLSYFYFDQATLSWVHNEAEYFRRVGNHPDRIDNVVSVYSTLFAAIKKVNSALEKIRFHEENEEENQRLHGLIDSMLRADSSMLAMDKDFLNGNSNPHIMHEFKLHFRNVSMIMDCISCEKCRLWGKIQVFGLGTALKILYASRSQESWSKLSLSRSEIISLLNTFGRFCESLSAMSYFHTHETNQSFFNGKSNFDRIRRACEKSPFVLVFALLGPPFIFLSYHVFRPRIQAHRSHGVK